MTTNNDTPQAQAKWTNERIGREAYKEFHLYADHTAPDGVALKLRCTPTIYCVDLMRRVRDDLQARIDELEAQLERARKWLPEGVLTEDDDE